MKTILHSDFFLQKFVALFLTLVSSKDQYKHSSWLFSWDGELYLVPSGRLHVANYSLPLPIVCFCQHERFSCLFSPTSFQWDIDILATDNSLTTLLISLVWIKGQPYPNMYLAT